MVAHVPRAHRVALGKGAEFDLIRKLLAGEDELPADVLVGPGDDAAVLAGGWVVSTDLSVENVHFRRSWIPDLVIGYRAGAAALSDLAAMAARPVGVLVSLAIPPEGGADAKAVHAGIREAARDAGAVVLGGDLSRSPGPLMVDVVVLGRADKAASRVGAEVGDDLWVTGALGASAAAVRLWTSGMEPPEALRRAFSRPVPRVLEAIHLMEQGVVHALIDLSDGLAGDAGHLAAASGVKVVLEAARIPVAEAARSAMGADALDAALYGGEDYELCFAAPAGAVRENELSVPLTCVGHVEAGTGVWLDEGGGAPRLLERGGYSHVEGGRP